MDDRELESLNDWVTERGLRSWEIDFDYADMDTGKQKAVSDLAWPEGLQPGLTTPVAVLLVQDIDDLSVATAAGFRCFTTLDDFRQYVENEILAAETT